MSLDISPLTPAIGAEIAGVDLARPLSDADTAALGTALLEHKVLFFRGAPITAVQFRDFGRAFGVIESMSPALERHLGAGVSVDPDCREVMRIAYDRDVVARENFWHFDLAASLQPSAATLLVAREVPAVGGDTLFADMARAYEGLKEATRRSIDGLVGLHDFLPMRRVLRAKGASAAELSRWDETFPLVEFPLVREHPITGRRMLWACETYTVGIRGMHASEAAGLLDQLFRRIWVPDYQCRFRWTEGAVAFWDNNACQHYAACDYWPGRRVMERLVLATLLAGRPPANRDLPGAYRELPAT